MLDFSVDSLCGESLLPLRWTERGKQTYSSIILSLRNGEGTREGIWMSLLREAAHSAGTV